MQKTPTRQKPTNEVQARSPQDILREPYARILIPAGDGTYCAEVLEFPGCYAEGDTPDEAIGNLEGAAASWIEAALEQGQEIPAPLASHGYSGKIHLRLPKSIHRQAACFAQRDDVSLNQFFIGAIAARVGAEEFYDHLVQRFENRLMPTAGTVNVQHISVFHVGQRWAPFGGIGLQMPAEPCNTITVELYPPTSPEGCLQWLKQE